MKKTIKSYTHEFKEKRLIIKDCTDQIHVIVIVPDKLETLINYTCSMCSKMNATVFDLLNFSKDKETEIISSSTAGNIKNADQMFSYITIQCKYCKSYNNVGLYASSALVR
jgi:DNA-directed RNA polymerase subunit RPC12/RpoP